MNLIKNHYVFTSFEISKQLNQLESFKNYCADYHDYYYDKNGKLDDAESMRVIDTECPAITQSHVQKFLRDMCNIIIEPIFDETQNDGYNWLLNLFNNRINIINEEHELFGTYYDSYEEVLEIGMKESLNLIK